MSATGALRFGRYAFPPNRLGYCGPDDHDALLGYVVSGQADRGLEDLGRRFEGAYPYLQLIATANGIADPFDWRVVEAYWIGNHLLDRVGVRAFHDSIEDRFGKRIAGRELGWLAHKIEAGATPHHNFHVFEVYSRAGLTRGEASGPVLQVMDSCRISWARVLELGPGMAVVSRQPLALSAGRLALGAAGSISLQRFVGAVIKPGDWVSVHWNWACEALSASQLRRLRDGTTLAIQRFNETV